MSDIVIAVSIGPLAVLPGPAPVDGGEGGQQSALGEAVHERLPGFAREYAALFQNVLVWGVVINARLPAQMLERRDDDVALGRMQIAARWIAPQLPACALIRLGGGNAEGVLEK